MGKKKQEKIDALFGDTNEEAQNSRKEASFAEMFEAGSVTPDTLEVGSQIKGEVISIGAEEVFLSVGGALDGVLPKKDLAGKAINVGDALDVRVVRVGENAILLKLKNSSSTADVDSLEDAFDMELPVQGLVTGSNKGGFDVKISGMRAFCPMSHMDVKKITDAKEFVGKKYEFIITKYEDRDLVVSRRKVLELQMAEAEGRLLSEINEGDVVSAEITRFETFGAFAKIAGEVEGLIHISELSWGRVNHPGDAVNIGDQVEVKVLKIEDGDRLRISLSLKQGGAVDPWTTAPSEYPLGTICEGHVEKKMPFGLFVNITRGVTGLLPKSSWREAVDSKIFDKLSAGDKVKVRVAQWNLEERKLSLGVPGQETGEESWQEYSQQQSSSTKSMGTFADLFKK